MTYHPYAPWYPTVPILPMPQVPQTPPVQENYCPHCGKPRHQDYTFTSWFTVAELPPPEEGPLEWEYVVSGKR